MTPSISQSGGKSESAFDPPWPSVPPACPVTIWTVRAIADLSQSHWLKTQPPLRWFPLLGCLRVSQSLAWVLSKHLGEGLAREPPSSWGPYEQGASQPAGPPSSCLHPPLLPATPSSLHPSPCTPLLPSPSSSLHPFCGQSGGQPSQSFCTKHTVLGSHRPSKSIFQDILSQSDNSEIKCKFQCCQPSTLQ